MKRFAITLAALAIVGLVSAAYAPEGKKEKGKGNYVRGTVTKVEGMKLTVKTMAGKGKEGEEKEYELAEGASIQVDGADAKAADLKDKMVALQVTDGKVSRVVSPPP